MSTLLVSRGRANVVHEQRLLKAVGNKELPWDVARFVLVMANIGAHRIPGTNEYRDWWGWKYRLSNS